MATPYVYERQSEYWTSRQIEEFFLDNGYEVITLPIPQTHEFNLPADFIYFDKGNSKIFGFQYKALYRNGRDHWPLDAAQHRELSRYSWLYYCFSELKDYRNARAALHFARIVNTGIEYQESIYPYGQGRIEFYSRWGAFYQGLVQCRKGVKVTSKDELLEILYRMMTENSRPG
jgi:hypothetical protein